MPETPPDSPEAEADIDALLRRVRELESRLAAEQAVATDQFRCAVESAPNGIIMTDGDGMIHFANQRARELFGYPTEAEMKALSIEQLMPERYRGRHSGLREQYHDAPEPRPMGIGRDLYACRKDGTEFPVEIGLTPIEIGGQRIILAMIADITERKKATAALAEKANILANVHEAVFTVDSGGSITSWNSGAAEIFGWDESDIVGASIATICPPDEPDRFSQVVLADLGSRGYFESTLRCHRRDGTPVTLAIRASHATIDRKDSENVAIICAHDITRQRELEEQIVQISEKEQRRIGQDIHDDLCQQLAGIGCLAQVIQQQLTAAGHEPFAASLNQIVELISQSNTRAREISRGLAPAVIQREGLTGALSELASRTRKIFGIPCAFHCPDPVFIDDETQAVQLYRIAQEAISNAIKHSDAGKIDVYLELIPRHLRLRITDDGRGMASRSASSSGLGLMTMAYRARILDGDLHIESQPGQGTSIICIAPHQNE
ncbi:MAG: PAS domain S-box protein [Verrucomicrobiae bacterium]|nr:PAS domain S-box protein [Verrucomicrobiae bacterium]